jgi:hypothetical protein
MFIRASANLVKIGGGPLSIEPGSAGGHALG